MTPTIEQVYAALPDRVKAKPAIWERLLSHEPLRAAVTYPDYFWEDNPNDVGRRQRSMPDEQLFSLMQALYEHLGGIDAEARLGFWKRV